MANVAAGVSEAEFLQAMAKAPVLGEEPDIKPQPVAADPPPLPASSSSSSSTSAAPVQDRNAVYEERKARIEQKRAAEEKEEREKRLARERTRRESITADPPGRSSNTTYLEQQRKRQLAAQEERQRVLRLLENDKIERRQKEAKRKQTLAEDHDRAPGPAAKESVPQSPALRPTGTETAISFRLLDGSSLKAKFPSLSLLGTDVRQWLDANRDDGDHPYSFLQILAPLPNKQLSISDENSSLADLGLSPTATLVLVPAQSYTTAYRGGGTSTETGILSKAYSMFYGAVAAVLGVGYPTHTPPASAPPPAAAPPAAPAAAPPPAVPAPPPAPAPAPPLLPAPTPRAAPVPSRPGTSGGLPMSRTNSGNGRIHTLYDQRDGEAEPDGARKYYNGNQVRGSLRRTCTCADGRSWISNRSRRRKGRGRSGRSE